MSNHGGTSPAWSRNGRALYYAETPVAAPLQRMMIVAVTTGPALTAGLPRALFEGRFYDSNRATQMIYVQNWFEE